MGDAKPFYQSKTFWINVVALVGMIVGSTKLVDAQTQVEILGALNILNRFLTDGPVTLTPSAAERINK
jgi:hypothetical protein